MRIKANKLAKCVEKLLWHKVGIFEGFLRKNTKLNRQILSHKPIEIELQAVFSLNLFYNTTLKLIFLISQKRST